MPFLDDIFDEETAENVRKQIDAQCTANVKAVMLPYRVRFYGVVIGLVVGVAIALTGYVHTVHEFDRRDAIQANRVCVAVQGNYKSLRLLIVRATPTKPRVVTGSGQPTKYTKAQIKEILTYRRYLLSGLHKPPPCIPRQNLGNAD